MNRQFQQHSISVPIGCCRLRIYHSFETAVLALRRFDPLERIIRYTCFTRKKIDNTADPAPHKHIHTQVILRRQLDSQTMKSMPKNKINTILILFQDILSHNQIRSIQSRTKICPFQSGQPFSVRIGNFLIEDITIVVNV